MGINVPSIYEGFNKWIDNNAKLLQFNANSTPEELSQNQEYQDLAKSTTSVFNLQQTKADQFFNGLENLFGMDKNEETIFGKLANMANEIFDLKTQENYNNNIAELGQGELLEKDIDNNGSLSIDEYINAELVDYGDVTIEEKAMIAAQSHALFQILDEATGASDKNGELSAQELATYYKNVDRFENGTLIEEGKQDGSFSVDDATGLTSFLMENMIGQENLDNLYNVYLKKYILEEQMKNLGASA